MDGVPCLSNEPLLLYISNPAPEATGRFETGPYSAVGNTGRFQTGPYSDQFAPPVLVTLSVVKSLVWP
jgi:hypothetical protein